MFYEYFRYLFGVLQWTIVDLNLQSSCAYAIYCARITYAIYCARITYAIYCARITYAIYCARITTEYFIESGTIVNLKMTCRKLSTK